jgi:hypothetical protein
MSEEEIFREITRPKELDGKNDWGIPPLTDEQPSPALTVRSCGREKRRYKLSSSFLLMRVFSGEGGEFSTDEAKAEYAHQHYAIVFNGICEPTYLC